MSSSHQSDRFQSARESDRSRPRHGSSQSSGASGESSAIEGNSHGWSKRQHPGGARGSSWRGGSRSRGGWRNRRPYSTGATYHDSKHREHHRQVERPVRAWRPHGHAEVARSAAPVTVLSYNVLAPALLRQHSYLYKHCRPDTLPWKVRQPLLLAEILEQDPDVICLQEVEEKLFAPVFLRLLRQAGYDGSFKRRNGGKPDGVATFYKRKKFELEEMIKIDYAFPGYEDNRENVAIIARLRVRDDGKQAHPQLLVANTHILYNPKRGDIKLVQAAMLLNRLATVKESTTMVTKVAPATIICGDFNCTHTSPVFVFLRTGRLPYCGLNAYSVSGQQQSPRHNKPIDHKFLPRQLRDMSVAVQCADDDTTEEVRGEAERTVAYKTVKKRRGNLSKPIGLHQCHELRHNFTFDSAYSFQHDDGSPEITTLHQDFQGTIDYILHTPELVCTETLDLLSVSSLRKLGGLPGVGLPSDHQSIVAKFLLMPSTAK